MAQFDTYTTHSPIVFKTWSTPRKGGRSQPQEFGSGEDVKAAIIDGFVVFENFYTKVLARSVQLSITRFYSNITAERWSEVTDMTEAAQ